MHTYIHTCTHTHIHTYIHTYMCVYVCIHVYLEVIEWLFSDGPLYLTLVCNIGLRQLLESNIGTNAKANIA